MRYISTFVFILLSFMTVYGSEIQQEPSSHVTDFAITNITDSELTLTWTGSVGEVLPDYYVIYGTTYEFFGFEPWDGYLEQENLDFSSGSVTVHVSHVDGENQYTFTNLESNQVYSFSIYPYTFVSEYPDYKTDQPVPTVMDTTLYFGPVLETCSNDTTLSSGSDLNLLTVASGEGLSYQWFKNEDLISGAQNTELSLYSADASTSASYWCMIWNEHDTVFSRPISVIIEESATNKLTRARHAPLGGDKTVTNYNNLIINKNIISAGKGLTWDLTGNLTDNWYEESYEHRDTSGVEGLPYVNLYKFDPIEEPPTLQLYAVTDTGLYNQGMTSEAFSLIYDPMLEVPFGQGYSFMDIREILLDAGFIQADYNIRTIIDGEGTLIFPTRYSPYKDTVKNAIRVKQTIIGESEMETEMIVVYQWFAEGYRHPIVNLSFSDVNGEASYYYLSNKESFESEPKGEPSEHVTDLLATAIDSTEIELTWTGASGEIIPDNYLIHAFIISDLPSVAQEITDGNFYADDQEWSGTSAFVNLTHQDGSNSYRFTDLEPSTVYGFNIYPYSNSGTDSDFKTDGTIPFAKDTTFAVPTEPLSYPTELAADVIDHATIELSWTGTTGEILPDSYLVIGRDLTGTTPDLPGIDDGISYADDPDWSDGIIVTNLTHQDGRNSITFDGLRPSTVYEFTIWPYTGTGLQTDYKTDGVVPSVKDTTKDEVLLTEPANHVTGLSVTDTTSSSFTIRWTGATGNPQPHNYLFHVIKESKKSVTIIQDNIHYAGNEWKNGEIFYHVTHSSGDNEMDITDLEPDAQYRVFVYPYTKTDDNVDYKTDGDVPELAVKTKLELGYHSIAIEESIKVYPVPADDHMFIKIQEGVELSSIQYQLFSVMGKLVKQGTLYGKEARLETSDLPGGMYFLKLETPAGSRTVRTKILHRH